MWIPGFLERIFSRKSAGNARSDDVHELRRRFQIRYHHFKLLLNANNKALEIMADMEQALQGGQPFGMSFVKSACTAVSVSVMQIIRHLNEIAPGRHKDLAISFKSIQEQVNLALLSSSVPKGTRLVADLEEVDKSMADEVGSKMANLGEIISRLKLPVPPGFVVTALGYQRFMDHNDLQPEIDRRIQAADAGRLEGLHALSAEIRQLIIRSPMPAELEQAMFRAYALLEGRAGRGARVSLRSSALGEDVAGTSFAGQYLSQLNVSAENMIQAYKEIVASKYTLQAMSYRFNRGIRDEDVAMCVGCMAMVCALVGGVIYSRNPVAPRQEAMVVNSVWGLPKAVVDGSAQSDLFVVSRDASPRILHREVRRKDWKLGCTAEEGLTRTEVSEEESVLPSLSDAEVLRLAEIASKLEAHYGCAQDIEWALGPERTIHLLQCRPLQPAEGGQEWTERLARRAEGAPALLSGGVTASPGAACGPVFIVRKNADLLRFTKGSVMVAAQPLPRWASIVSQAAAVVAEQGGVTGHLASVAREFGIPAIFGLAGALNELQEGQEITVDADGCRVHRGRLESLLARTRPATHLMEGSPVHTVLKEAAKHIIPLNLLDPDGPDFHPGRCRTMHDITRYAHEKSVEEMFRFGRDHHFQERASKQLVTNIPMQLWVLNLDDGFKSEVRGKYVDLQNIASLPMRALWEGMTAVPWEGPPPIDAKGLMAVMFQATVNPNLDPALAGPYSDRNYFMISKNFCSLQSRFGFHFATVETLVSERSGENYVSFQFKGGAADYHRRQTRVLFVGSLLEEHEFRIEVKGDALFARLEGLPQDTMIERLRILGYLIIHTRQLDMIMSNSASIGSYKEKMRADIARLPGKTA